MDVETALNRATFNRASTAVFLDSMPRQATIMQTGKLAAINASTTIESCKNDQAMSAKNNAMTAVVLAAARRYCR